MQKDPARHHGGSSCRATKLTAFPTEGLGGLGALGSLQAYPTNLHFMPRLNTATLSLQLAAAAVGKALLTPPKLQQSCVRLTLAEALHCSEENLSQSVLHKPALKQEAKGVCWQLWHSGGYPNQLLWQSWAGLAASPFLLPTSSAPTNIFKNKAGRGRQIPAPFSASLSQALPVVSPGVASGMSVIYEGSSSQSQAPTGA